MSAPTFLPLLIGIPADTVPEEEMDHHWIGDTYVRAVAEVAGARPVVIPALSDAMALDALLDRPAVRAAFTLPWSNGQIEGHVNRLKFLKRQMYGRAGIDLLRQRVLNPN